MALEPASERGLCLGANCEALVQLLAGQLQSALQQSLMSIIMF